MATMARSFLLALIAALTFAATAGAHEPALGARLMFAHPHASMPPVPPVALVTPAGAVLGGQLQQWTDQSRVATGDYQLVIDPALDCGGAPACSTGPGGADPAGTPFATNVLMTGAFIPVVERDALYFELGHQFDWHFLTNADRLYLARSWKLTHWHWWDTPTGLSLGEEDGLEGMFAAIFSDCAEGQNDHGEEIGIFGVDGGPPTPTAHPTIDTCAYIDRVAAGVH